MNSIEIRDRRLIDKFINILAVCQFTEFNLSKFMSDNSVDKTPEEILRWIVTMPHEEAVSVLSQYGTQSDFYARDRIADMLMQANRELCFTGYEKEPSEKPSPMYPMWRGHKVPKRKKGW